MSERRCSKVWNYAPRSVLIHRQAPKKCSPFGRWYCVVPWAGDSRVRTEEGTEAPHGRIHHPLAAEPAGRETGRQAPSQNLNLASTISISITVFPIFSPPTGAMITCAPLNYSASAKITPSLPRLVSSPGYFGTAPSTATRMSIHHLGPRTRLDHLVLRQSAMLRQLLQFCSSIPRFPECMFVLFPK